MGSLLACLASVSVAVVEQRKSEERDFRCFARAKNSARAKKRKEGEGEGKEGNSFLPLSLPSLSFL